MPGDDRASIAHLYRRAGFGARPEELDAAVAAGYDATVERLVDLSAPDTAADALPLPAFSPPLLASDLPSDPEARRRAQQQEQQARRQEGQQLQAWWVDRMIVSSTPLREKLTLFWHDHFATSVQKVREPSLMLRQNQLFRSMGAGSFEALTQAVSKDPAMLVWLDSNSNRKQSPNENFARELFELFTVGIGNYTEDDIKNAARAFTGWQYQRQRDRFAIAAANHDDGPKTIFGQTGNFDGEDVVRMAVRHPSTAPFVTAALWGHFARPAGREDPVVRELSAGFARHLDVGTLMKAIFRHPEFVTPATRAGLVKQPIEYVAGTLRALGLRATSRGVTAVQSLNALGQVPFAPPTVAGWPQNGYWITTSFALARLRFATTVVQRANLGPITSVAAADRPAAAARLLGVDRWGPATSSALARSAGDAGAMLALALVSPEYVLA